MNLPRTLTCGMALLASVASGDAAAKNPAQPANENRIVTDKLDPCGEEKKATLSKRYTTLEDLRTTCHAALYKLIIDNTTNPPHWCCANPSSEDIESGRIEVETNTCIS